MRYRVHRRGLFPSLCDLWQRAPGTDRPWNRQHIQVSLAMEGSSQAWPHTTNVSLGFRK